MSFSLLVWKWSTSTVPGRAHEIAEYLGERTPPTCLASFAPEAFLREVSEDFGLAALDEGPLLANVYNDPEVDATWIDLDIAWSAADRAREVIPVLASRFGLVVFDLQIGSIPEPCRPKTFAFSVEGRRPIYDPTLKEVTSGLRTLDSRDPSFAILEAANGDYLQVAGNPDLMTVEWRNGDSATFRHLVGARAGATGSRTLQIPSSGGHVTVLERQALRADEVLPVFACFLHNKHPGPSLSWDDVTDRFR